MDVRESGRCASGREQISGRVPSGGRGSIRKGRARLMGVGVCRLSTRSSKERTHTHKYPPSRALMADDWAALAGAHLGVDSRRLATLGLIGRH